MLLDAVISLTHNLGCLVVVILALAGLGFWFLRLLEATILPSYWTFPLSLVLGEAILSFAVQAALFLGANPKSALVWIGFGAVATGVVGCAVWFRSLNSFSRLRLSPAERFLLCLTALSLLVNFSISAAPSTKIDEIYYHMLLPKRIVSDGGLKFYQEPIEQAVLPQMHYQIALSIGHALGEADIGNLVSFLFSLALLVALAGSCYEITKNTCYSFFVAAVAAAGLYTSVWHTTSGAHALGDLSTFLVGAILLTSARERLGEVRSTVLVSILCCSSASTKLSLWPIAALGTVIAIATATRSEHQSSHRLLTIVAGLTPWLVIHLPLMLWTWHASGSPWGPVGAGLFGPTVYPPSVAEELLDVRHANHASFGSILVSLVPRLSPLVVLAVPYTALRFHTSSTPQRIALCMLCIQLLVIGSFSLQDFRFLGGLQYIILFTSATLFFREKFAARILPHISILACLLIVPWIAVQWYYATPFLRLMSGSFSREAFLSLYVALYQDLRILNGMLPSDAILESENGRVPSLYFPRPVIFSDRDRDPHKRRYLFAWGDQGAEADGRRTEDFADCQTLVYQTEHAVVEAFRTPDRPPTIGHLEVWRCEDATQPR